MNAQAIVFLVGAIMNMAAGGTQSHHSAPSAHTCHIKFVSFAFTGAAGTAISYHGETYVIPAGGLLEIVAQQGEYSFQAAGYALRVDDTTPRDEFGSASVHVDQLIAQAMQNTAPVQLASAAGLGIGR